MEFVYPVQGVGNEEVGNLMLSIIKYLGSPVRMFPFARIRVFIHSQSVGISGEMSRNPVQNYANAFFMKVVNKILEVFGGTVTGGGSVIAGDLVAPGAVKGMLSNTHQLYMGIAHVLHIFSQLNSSLPVCIKSIFFFSVFFSPGAQMNLINTHGSFSGIGGPAFLQPGGIRPFIRGVRSDSRGGSGAEFGASGVGIRFKQELSGLGNNGKFVEIAFFQTWYKDFINSGGFQKGHGMRFRLPVVKIAY